VILEGRLRSAAAREAASRLAWETPGVFDVCNRLVVSAGSW
jgi:osmotically-inducible protein OsmY